MRNVLLCLFTMLLFNACNLGVFKRSIPRITTIGIQGEEIPQYTFKYDLKGNLTELAQHNGQDSYITSFTYDNSNHITDIAFSEQKASQKAPVLKARAKVNKWDKTGNITSIHYYTPQNQLIRTADIRWEKGLPVALKYSDTTLASCWNYSDKSSSRKDVYIDTSLSTGNDAVVTFRTTEYEPDDSINPLKPLVNQIVVSQSVVPETISPLGSLSNVFLHVGNNSPFLIRIAEHEKAICRQFYQEYERNTTYQYFYSLSNNNSFPDKAWVHLRSEGTTNLDTDANFIMFYKYE